MNLDINYKEAFEGRHIAPNAEDTQKMLQTIGVKSVDELIEQTVPAKIRLKNPLNLAAQKSEYEYITHMKELASKNKIFKSYIGMGYYDTATPGVIQRNILENPGWYTAYTPYQAEISQGRLEALLNYQTLVTDLTGLEIANASMLDEGTAAAEAMMLAHRVKLGEQAAASTFFVSARCHPQTIDIVRTRAKPLNISVVVGDHATFDFAAVFARAHAAGALCIVATDLLALTLLKAPGEFGADVAVGSAQRFGVPMGFGGPHAGFLATKDEFKRQMPGRLVGVSKDAQGNLGLRLALGTREQHIRRDKATSNICTAQVLLAVMASMYAVYHGPAGLKRIALRVATFTAVLAEGLGRLGFKLTNTHAFDTLTVETGARTDEILQRALDAGANLRRVSASRLGITLDETTTREDVAALWSWFAAPGQTLPSVSEFEKGVATRLPEGLQRTSAYLTHPVFNTYHSETEMLRYLRRLSDKDMALDRSMITLGSCTTKLNATS